MKKRPMRMKPEAVQTLQESAVLTKPTMTHIELANQDLRAHGKLARPSGEEFTAMLAFICEQYQCSLFNLAHWLEIDYPVMKRASQGLPPRGPAGKLIWVIYQFLRNPAVLRDKTGLALYGRQYAKLPKRISNLRELLKAYVAEHPGVRFTSEQILKAFLDKGMMVDRSVLYSACKAIGYKLKPNYRKPMTIIMPNSAWMAVDWSKTDQQIATALGVHVTTVRINKRKLRQLPHETLVAAFVAAGRDASAVEVLMRNYKRFRQ